MRFLFVFIFFLAACAGLQKKPALVDCVGEASSKSGIVYLHGMDIPEKSTQELTNREVITRIAAKIGARVAFPRAEGKCPGSPSLICWGWKFDVTELRHLKQQIASAAAACGAPPGYIVLGFSNGGYAVNRLFEECLMEPDQLQISVAAGNRPFKRMGAKESPLEKCGTLKMIVGNKDHHNNQNTLQYVDDLKKRDGKVILTEFPGKHEIPEADLLSALSSD